LPDSSVPAEGVGASAPPPSALLHAALAYASRGWAVFPVAGIREDRTCNCAAAACDHPGKHPVTRHGVHDASTYPARIRAWWSLHPWANVAIATGHLVVVDVDPDAGGWNSLGTLVDNDFAVPRTATVITGSGGVHLYYLAPEGEALRNTAGRLPGVSRALPGIDLRATGGYVIAPPSRHASGRRYQWISPTADVAAPPAWLRQPPSRPRRPLPARGASGTTTAYGAAALRAELVRLARVVEGSRNHELNRAAFAAGQLAAAGHLNGDDAVGNLIDAALTIGLGQLEARRTVDSGFKAGLREPRALTGL
jgi:hypothetical protein